jgi:hypothetical protein
MTLRTDAPEAAARPQAQTRRYLLQGTILEACTCNVLCPCWIGEDPDNGICDALLAYHFDHGVIGEVDVSGLTLVGVGHIPGNILQGNWTTLHLVDEHATEEQFAALADAFQGRLGGPLADFFGLISAYHGMIRAPIEYKLVEGKGSIAVGDQLRSVMAPHTSAYGTRTTLRDSVFSTIPGSPAWVSKASETMVHFLEYGLSWSVQNRNAIQGEFKFEA